MTYFIISTFINAVACGSCCILILVNNYKSKTVKNFALFNCTVALWSFFYFLSMLATHYQEALFYSRTLNTIALFIPPTFLSFCIQITDNKNALIKKLLYFFLALDILILPFVPTELYIQKMAHLLIFPFWPVPGPLFHLSGIEFFILIPISLHLLKIKISQSKSNEKQQLKIIYYSLITSFLGGATNFFLCVNIPIIPYGNALVSVFVFGFMYCIFKYRLMDINVALSRSFVYTILIFLITLLYFMVTHLTNIYLTELTGYKSFIFSFLCAAITALAFVPLQEKLQRIIDKIFLKKSVEEIEKENQFLRQEVTDSDRLKSVAILASGMAHEIKNPLTTLKVFSEYISTKRNDPEFIQQYEKIVPQEIDRINNLIHELLVFAKPSSPQLQTIDPNKIIQNILTMLEHQLKSSSINTNVKFNTDIDIQADPNQLKQALLNLILNAIDAMQAGGIFSILTHANYNHYLSKFSEHGFGIYPKRTHHIFEPFYTKKKKVRIRASYKFKELSKSTVEVYCKKQN